jgi:Protein of unknown function (DUF3617)
MMRQEVRMQRLAMAGVLILSGAMPAMAADLPHRKPGLWEVKTRLDNAARKDVTSQICIDAATDEMTMMIAGPLAQETCSKIEVQRSGDAVTIDAACTLGGKAAMAHTVMTGSFDSAYTTTTTVQNDGLPGGAMTMTAAATWLGPCAADQKPGDMIMGNVKLNIPELRNRAPSQGIPLPR